MIRLSRLLDAAYHNRLVARLLHTTVHCLQRHLRDCDTVLDLGCGPSSPLQHCNVAWTVGVEAYPPYIRESAQAGIHSACVLGDVTRLGFAPKSVDAVIVIEVLEHLEREDGEALLNQAARWARKRVIVTTPNGFLPQRALGGNPRQRHRSGWTVDEMRRRGFRAYGLAGWRGFHSENRGPATEEEAEGLFDTIRWRPRWLWLLVSALSQLATYHLPERSFEVFCVRDLAPPSGER